MHLNFQKVCNFLLQFRKMYYKKAHGSQQEEELIIEPVPKGQYQKSTHGRTSSHNVLSNFIGHFYYNMIERKMLCFCLFG